MTQDQLIDAGAFALYRAENGHRVSEFNKHANGNELIRKDFEEHRPRYVRMFEDIRRCFEDEGLAVKAA